MGLIPYLEVGNGEPINQAPESPAAFGNPRGLMRPTALLSWANIT